MPNKRQMLFFEDYKGCWISLTHHARNKKGYILLCRDGEKTRLHRYMYELHNGPIPKGMCVCHTCDNPSCGNPAHLFLGTYAENNHDRDRKGRQITPRGERHGMAKLTEGEVRNILHSDEHRLVLAKKYGVSKWHIDRLRRGGNWNHLLREQSDTETISMSDETRASIERGLKQTGTISHGSFAKYAKEEEQGDGEDL